MYLLSSKLCMCSFVIIFHNYYCSMLNTLTPLDAPAVVFIATENRVEQAEYRIDSDGHELWPLRQSELDISGASILAVDVMENNIFWINKTKKVRRFMIKLYCVCVRCVLLES